MNSVRVVNLPPVEAHKEVLYTWDYGDIIIDVDFYKNEFNRITVYRPMDYGNHISIEADDLRLSAAAVAGIFSGIKEVALNALHSLGIQL